MQPERLDQIVALFPPKRILIAGDLMLDEFVWGRVSRISPEAPVPVVEVLRESQFPGGAANVARNVRTCGARTIMMGALGEDSHGARLKDLLRGEKIELDGVVELSGYQTIVKTRIIARHQQVVRVDREVALEPSDEVRQQCIKQLHHLLPDLDAVILEDYGKGFLTQSLVDEIVAQVRRAGKIVTADPNTRNPLVWRGLTAIKPNRAEAFAAAEERYSEPGPDPLHDKALLRVGATLLKRWAPEQLLITLGEQGMLLLQSNAEAYHVPSRAREIYDVSGAGDTAIAFLSLALAAGANPVEAAEISNHASGVAVAKLGTATVSLEELRESFRART